MNLQQLKNIIDGLLVDPTTATLEIRDCEGFVDLLGLEITSDIENGQKYVALSNMLGLDS